MDTQAKLDILSRDAQYDLSCACGTKDPREHRVRNQTGEGWLYPMTTASGGAGIILKTLLGNRCVNDCKYCPLRRQNDFRPVAVSPVEMASFFYQFQLHRPLLGLFLSSAVMGDGEKTMQMLVDTARILRAKYQYKGYIHLKVIPGASPASIDAALRYASAVSLNIETPGASHFRLLTERKDYHKDIIEPLKYIASHTGRGTAHPRVKTTSQFIVGAGDESDREIVSYCGAMYQDLHMERLYFSAYQRGLGDADLPGERQAPVVVRKDGELFGTDVSAQASLLREHRLYQTDFLLRKYHFSSDEILFGPDGNLSLDKDPKLVWAEAHPEFYPVSVRTASLDQLLRVPGIGPQYAKRIVNLRKSCSFGSLDALPLPQFAKARSKGFLIL
ncbi:MAG: helix-hairpin-helix domain-containing protein [Sphaerochaeta sp.]|jgi:predicted DNA-binding helix-hairpin-helix protein|nr:helix-hairpin-helix domain-containing protein [Sphaerochaeta sp.]MCH3920155.1 helix-hairpin-helix domain-containing protein [Sphaerochaeta sp.]MCI2045209.1 helix-hairpin-helix domain-containing protein [Sphaerochaeta sp.]MCI2096339.1 helix-hairpin-helix domain-containing protein [Sphaerochaeta sp.]MCI2104087.1 helix-hairpin-helix domain-containing protein [Sphaerochaeta sp.]